MRYYVNGIQVSIHLNIVRKFKMHVSKKFKYKFFCHIIYLET